MPKPDGGYVNARVFPMRGPDTAPKPWLEEREAILWQAGAIVAVGTNEEIRQQARDCGIEVEDAGGRVILPGFVDAHTHFLHIGVKRHRPDMSVCRSKEDALASVLRWLESHPGAEPVIGDGWDESSWPTPERPTRRELDAVVAAAATGGAGPRDRVLVLRRVCGHIAVANSPALALIRARWSDPTIVDLDTGLLLEQASLYLNEVIPTGDALIDEALQEATQECLRLGITAVGDYSQAPYRKALQRAAAAGRLRLRIASSVYVQQLEHEIAAGFRTGQSPPAGSGRGDQTGAARIPDDVAGAAGTFLRDGGLKVFLDGSLGAHTAALREDYGDGGHHPRGLLNWSDTELGRLFARAHAAGIQIHAHAIGDAAVDQGLAAFATLAARSDIEAAGWNANLLRHRFEHYEIVHDDQLRRTAELGLVASSQPNFVGTWSSKGGMYEHRLGPRFALNNRFRAMLAAGIPVAFGSDGMPPGPLVGISAAAAHPDPMQRMESLEAIWHYTWWSAWSLHWEKAIGSLEAGKQADVVILEDNADLAIPDGWQIWRVLTDGISR